MRIARAATATGTGVAGATLALVGKRVAGAVALAAGLAAFAPWSAAGQGTLEGAVRSAETGAALAGAQVSLPELAMGGVAGPDGDYRIAGIPAGTHAVEVQLVGRRPERREVTISQGRATRLDVVLFQDAVALEGLVAVGSRTRPRTATESMTPVDAIAGRELAAQGDTDLSDLLRTVVPSFNTNPVSGGDGAAIVRPANLRGLAPDHTLVLVNGRRRHRAAIIAWFGGGVSDGAQGADISAIPAIALRQVEVLRDAAAAQYGSDAIAGVINLQLKDDRSGGSMEVRSGRFADGGGDNYAVSANAGLPLGDHGFANLSAEIGSTGATSRSVQRADAALLTAAGNTHVRDPAQVWGSPEIEDDVKLWGNFGRFFGDDAQLYGHANYARERVTSGFFFRNPNTRSAVFSADGGETLLVGDVLDAQDGTADGSADCPVVRVADGLPDQAALARVFADPNCFSFQELFPGGFTPQFGGIATDASAVAGVRGQTDSGLRWDAGAGFGSNAVDFFIRNTVNASLGPATPTSFDPGVYEQQELHVNLDASYPVGETLDLAGGAEWREERFHIGLGEQASWEIGPYAAQGFSSGSNGFPGFGPLAAGSWRRANYALYADAELRDSGRAGHGDRTGERESDAFGRWTVGASLRVEDFADFGATGNGKLAARAALADALALRGSVSTGFRAPTPGQQNAFNVSTDFDPQTGRLVNSGTIPSTSRVAALKGGQALQPERSVAVSVGAVVESGSFSATADYFRITVSDRMALTQSYYLTEDEKTALLAEGITSARNLQNFRFFTNDFETLTQGADVVAALASTRLGGATEFTFVFNYTDTRVVQSGSGILDDTRIRQIEESLPQTRWAFSATHAAGPVRLLARVSWYDGWFDAWDDTKYDGAHLLDVEASYEIAKSTTVSAGAQNALNTYPPPSPSATFTGSAYSSESPFGYNGGYLYLRAVYRW